MSIPLFCGIVGVIITLIGASKSYKFPLLVFIAYQPFNIFVQDLRAKSIAINPTNGLLLIILASYLLTAKNTHSTEETKATLSPPIKTSLILFIFTIIISAFYSAYFSGLKHIFIEEGGFSAAKVWITPMVMYFAYYYSFTKEKDKKTVITIMMLTSLVISLDAIWEYKLIGGYDDDRRIKGFIGQPNELSVFLVIYPFVYLSLIWYKKVKVSFKIALAATSFFSIVAMCFTLSRGAYLSLLVGASIFMVYKSKKTLTAIILLTIIAGPILIPKDVMRRINDSTVETSSGVQLEGSAASRLDIWSESYRIFKEHPFGIGFGLIPYYMEQEIDSPMDTHNIYLHVLLETGIIGFITFLFLLKGITSHAITVARRADNDFDKYLSFGFVICTISLMVRGLTGSHFIYAETYNHFWALAALSHNSKIQNLAKI